MSHMLQIKNRDQNKTGNDSDSDDDSTSSFDHIAVYRQMLELMKPGESVAKALRRFGGNKTMSASERWRRRKEGRSDSNDTDTKLVTQLTELANQLVNRIGNMDVYQETYEHISKLIRNADAKKGKSSVRTAASYDDALDMYADDFDEKEKERLAKQPEKPSSEDEQSNSNEVMWEFKWEESSSDIHGPHSSSQMQSWVEQGYFKSSVLVRKCGSEGQFYNSARVDFELYM
ncbi:hypothetical protein L9F63_028205 [Diploptera punctata]|uniref:GYF domain-containing protein n=1 Tax=Diploptera punctata TaxID=6984 RepID=A0AAD7ZVP8_DIPPU|nr:hypothetical protein L9F63_028205 [Diploptera punctata]